jgi:cytidine deaminase
VLASVCVARAPDPESGFPILAPCGVCQERLMIYGPDVEVAVPEPADPARWRALRLAELQPYWWGRVVPGSAWPYE